MLYNRANFAKVSSDFPIEVILPQECDLTGRVVEIGLGGAVVETNRFMSPTARFIVEIGPYGLLGTLELLCEVVECKRGEENGWVNEVKYYEMSTTQTQYLGRYMVELLRK